MGRREIREHIFRILFLQTFYPNSEELAEQAGIYLEDAQKYGIPVEEETEEGEPTCAPCPTPEERFQISDKANKIIAKIPELDEKINQAAEGWNTRRMGKVELTTLRLALYEILFDDDIPEKVAINEGVELAKTYGQDGASSFVNGVLARLVK